MQDLLRAASISFAVVCLSGSALAEHQMRKWAKPDTTYDQYLSDRRACMAEGRDQAPIIPIYSTRGIIRATQPISAQGVTDCMMARGYVEDEANGFTPPDGADLVIGGAVMIYPSRITN